MTGDLAVVGLSGWGEAKAAGGRTHNYAQKMMNIGIALRIKPTTE